VTDPSDLAIDPEWTERILCRFVAAEVRRTGRARVVVGLSGGLDSAVAATLAVEALGRDNVLALVLPHRASSPASRAHAELLIGRLGIVAEAIDISAMTDAFLASTQAPGKLRLGNAMARMRMILLYDRSAAWDALVLGTSNKTEILLGYGTIHGDLASALNPLGDLYKTQVRQLAAHLRIPAPIRKKAPSADLWPDQSDEQDLGFTYENVDRLLALLVDARVRPETAVRSGFPRRMVQAICGRIVRSQFKRKLPVVAKVSTRSVGWDFRYPRDWKS
jgi:NAD+ synthase